MCAATVQKRTARVKPSLSVRPAATPRTLIGMLPSISLWLPSCSQLFRPVVDLHALRSVRKGRDKPPSFMRGFMTS